MHENGFHGRLTPGVAPALLVVDLVRAYTEPDGPLHIGERTTDVLAATRELVAVARNAGRPIVWTSIRFEQGGGDGRVFFQKVPVLARFVGETEAGRFASSCAPATTDLVIVKQHPSAFAGTGLALTLRMMGVDTVVIAGVSTSGCVRATATDAMTNGFVPFVVADAVGDRDTAAHDANLHDIGAKIGEVVGLAEASACLDPASATP